jgi:choline kinase
MTPDKHPPSPRAVILSAGQGRRLLPLTEDRPKCLLPIGGKSLMEWQIDTLLAADVEEVVLVTGFGSERVESLVEERYGNAAVRVLFNPFYDVSDNLASCWIASAAMDADFLLLNGDTVFEPALLQRLLASPPAPITLTVDHKDGYDEDDMKVELDEDGVWLRHVSKALPPDRIHAESIGLTYFRERGAALFRQAVQAAMRRPSGLSSWYLAVIDALAAQQVVTTCAIDGLRWAEIDFAGDLKAAETLFNDSGDDSETVAQGA